MTTRSEWIHRLQTSLDSLDAQVDELRESVRNRGTGSPKREQALRVLEEKRDAARAKLKEAKEAGEPAWGRLKKGVGKVWSQLEETFEETKSAFREGLKHGEKDD